MTAISNIDKKREVLPFLHRLIVSLSNLTGECAELEVHDNDKCSRILKKRLSEIEHTEFRQLKDAVYATRNQIMTQKLTNKKNKQQQKNQKNESESEKLQTGSGGF